jgi:hypothetical protein
MKSKTFFLVITALALLLSANSPATACGMSLIKQDHQNPNFIIVDRDTGDKLLCHRANQFDKESGLVCSKMPTINEPKSAVYPLPVPKTLESVPADMFANALWMLIIIGIHFIFGLVHTWFREKKKK